MNIFKKLTQAQKTALILLIFLILSLPVALWVAQRQQEIRPRAAITGQANFHLTSSNASPNAGDTINVSVSLDLTSSTARVSGVDFRILYDKNKLSIGTVTPAIGDGQPFTDMVVKQVDKPWNDTFSYARIVLVSNRLTPALASGSGIKLATINFTAKSNGSAIIKFPPQNQDSNGVDILQVVGFDTASPTCINRPPCLDAKPACKIPEPVGGWCPAGTDSPNATATNVPTSTENNNCQRSGTICTSNDQCCSNTCTGGWEGATRICL